jgi:hypothetical protein
MKHLTLASAFAPVLAVAAALLGILSRTPDSAYACTGPGTAALWSDTSVVFEGRVLSAKEDGESADGFTVGVELRIQVAIAYKGTNPGDILALQARVPKPQGQPLPCAGWSRDQQFEGKYIVAGLTPASNESRELGRWLTPFIADDPSGDEYAAASHWARVAASNDPSLPTLRLVRSDACGGTLTVTGTRFEPGTVVLVNFPGAWLLPEARRPQALIGPDGRFVASYAIPSDICEDSPYSYVEAYPSDPNQQLGGYPLAFTLFNSASRVPGPPDAGNSTLVEGTQSRLPANPLALAGAVLTLAGACLISRRRLTR